MYVCIYVCMYVCRYVSTYVYMYICMCVRMYVCMYVCMYVSCCYMTAILVTNNSDLINLYIFIKITVKGICGV